jgi:hypothetical protein
MEEPTTCSYYCKIKSNSYFSHLVASNKEATLATETNNDAIASFANKQTGGTKDAPTQSGSVYS